MILGEHDFKTEYIYIFSYQFFCWLYHTMTL